MPINKPDLPLGVAHDRRAFPDRQGKVCRCAPVGGFRREWHEAGSWHRFDRSLELAREAGDRSAEGAALAQLAWLAMAAGKYEEASELAGKSTELATETGDKLTASGALAAR